MAKNLKVGMLVCASLLAANAAYAENSATQEGMRFNSKPAKSRELLSTARQVNLSSVPASK